MSLIRFAYRCEQWAIDRIQIFFEQYKPSNRLSSRWSNDYHANFSFSLKVWRIYSSRFLIDACWINFQAPDSDQGRIQLGNQHCKITLRKQSTFFKACIPDIKLRKCKYFTKWRSILISWIFPLICIWLSLLEGNHIFTIRNLHSILYLWISSIRSQTLSIN